MKKTRTARFTGLQFIAAASTAVLTLGACAASPDVGVVSASTTSPPTETSTSLLVADETAGEGTVLATETEGATSVDQSELEARLAELPTGTLTAEEEDGLMWMREEEKLAHDVYVTLYDLWGLRIFSNIARAETTHTEAVKTILDRYGLADPAAANPVGVFTNPEIQALYDELIARGSQSDLQALEVGALIEDLDIIDLQSLQTDVADVAMLYANLERGSRNHLRAFVSNLEVRGESYVPVYLTAEAFETIIAEPMERGTSS